jgi:hypothetical protein
VIQQVGVRGTHWQQLAALLRANAVQKIRRLTKPEFTIALAEAVSQVRDDPEVKAKLLAKARNEEVAAKDASIWEADAIRKMRWRNRPAMGEALPTPTECANQIP